MEGPAGGGGEHLGGPPIGQAGPAGGRVRVHGGDRAAPGLFTPPASAVPLTTNRPGVAVAGNGSQYVYWKGTDNNLWEAFYDGRWNGPLNLNMGPLG